MLCVEFKTRQPEVLLALLSVYPFEGFQEFEDKIEAYIDDEAWHSIERAVRAGIKATATGVKTNPVPEKNWNAVWEASFTPVIIGDFCAIRASFHSPVGTCSHELVIDPKMAFGTGHHETTELMIRQMSEMHFSGKNVLDLGTGTGILAILASMLGAKKVTAVDNDPEAVQNAKENALVNGVHIHCTYGTVEDLPDETYDIVLANINRNVLIDSMPEMRRVVIKGGDLLLSGILITDRDLIVQTAAAGHLHPVKEKAQGEWLCLQLKCVNT